MDNLFLQNCKINLKHIKDEPSEMYFDELLNNILYEDLPKLINFTEKVNIALSLVIRDPCGDYQKGYQQAYEDLRRILYEKK